MSYCHLYTRCQPCLICNTLFEIAICSIDLWQCGTCEKTQISVTSLVLIISTPNITFDRAIEKFHFTYRSIQRIFQHRKMNHFQHLFISYIYVFVWFCVSIIHPPTKNYYSFSLSWSWSWSRVKIKSVVKNRLIQWAQNKFHFWWNPQRRN